MKEENDHWSNDTNLSNVIWNKSITWIQKHEDWGVFCEPFCSVVDIFPRTVSWDVSILSHDHGVYSLFGRPWQFLCLLFHLSLIFSSEEGVATHSSGSIPSASESFVWLTAFTGRNRPFNSPLAMPEPCSYCRALPLAPYESHEFILSHPLSVSAPVACHQLCTEDLFPRISSLHRKHIKSPFFLVQNL